MERRVANLFPDLISSEEKKKINFFLLEQGDFLIISLDTFKNVGA